MEKGDSGENFAIICVKNYNKLFQYWISVKQLCFHDLESWKLHETKSAAYFSSLPNKQIKILLLWFCSKKNTSPEESSKKKANVIIAVFKRGPGVFKIHDIFRCKLITWGI